ncbi:MAG TPA: hypothetical protein VEW46_25810 [Pyrinomonadaceae bacterium]|nr:hypothetical protein [Pyrinomonadaceae bacterium]
MIVTSAFLEKVGSAPDRLDLNKVPRVSGIYTTRGIIDAMKNNGGAAAFYTEDVGTRRYRGKVILLINKETGSASESPGSEVETIRETRCDPGHPMEIAKYSLERAGASSSEMECKQRIADLNRRKMINSPRMSVWGKS